MTAYFEAVLPHLDERQRRLNAGAMAIMLGRGGRTRVAESTGMSRSTVIKGANEIENGAEVTDRVRAEGAGDKPAVEKQPGLWEAIEKLVSPTTRGHPMSALLWTLKSTYELSREVKAQGFEASAELVRQLLAQHGYSLQAPSKQAEGTTHPDRDGQFRYLAELVDAFIGTGDPVISVDTKKKELLGNKSNGGTEYQPKGDPVRTDVHDFPDPALGKAIPYGVYDVTNNDGWVSVGDTADTSEFAVAAIAKWWDTLGKHKFPDAKRLLITADCGGSNGYRVRAWKWHLAQLAQRTGLEITVAHYPPGTSKWNKIEHRMFSFITINWRGRPLTNIRTVVKLISATTTQGGLTIQAAYDAHVYPKGVKITDTQFETIPITPHEWHGDWNYTISPHPLTPN
ncbi:MAG: ISAzo13 family transposase [Candidatus Microthrix sp.]|nr:MULTISPECIES: ISAzo13 family transposase [Microthrix]HBX78883.1 ISAzo13 family transposase [Acidimicrobiaceae bacterium]MBK6501747.1 ISAzo13 family transposase [Candidatus Microthrix sp.]MBK7018979.1 ISAzo13 family transposase [Candidatus Microthrix sp.]MBL0203348.1 ISAzo13 family transposase [Candidatus Microthrix sp.]MBP7405345.1 ISAzo13 family transposase [Candidatus Microthrix sp.]